MTEQQYKWQCPLCPTEINFVPEQLPESLTREIVEEVRKMNSNNYLMILAERGQHLVNHALKGEGQGIEVLKKIKQEVDKEEPLEEPKEELDEDTIESGESVSEGQGEDTETD